MYMVRAVRWEVTSKCHVSKVERKGHNGPGGRTCKDLELGGSRFYFRGGEVAQSHCN